MNEYDVIPTVPDRVTAEPAVQRAATRAVLLRFEDRRHTASDTLTILQALGLADTPPAPPIPRRRSTRQRGMDTRRAEREAEAS